MDPEIYSAYINALDEDSGQNFDRSLLDTSGRSKMLFSLKNYHSARGLSQKIHTSP